MGQHVRIRIQQRDLCVVWQSRMLEEVAGTRPDVQVALAHMLPVLLHESRAGAPPDNVAIQPEDHGVIDPQERTTIDLLAPRRPRPNGSRGARSVCVEEFGDQPVERFWRLQIRQVTGARNDVMSRIGDGAARLHKAAGSRGIVEAQ